MKGGSCADDYYDDNDDDKGKGSQAPPKFYAGNCWWQVLSWQSQKGGRWGSGGEILTAWEVSLPCPHILYLSLSPNLIIKFSCPGSNVTRFG